MTAMRLSASAFPDAVAMLLSRLGRPLDLAANAVLPLTATTETAMVETGSVDVFAVERDAEGRPGLRHFLTRVPAPGLVAGLGRAECGAIDVVAVSRGARLTVLDSSAVVGLAAVVEAQRPFAFVLDQWIQGLSAGLVQFLAVRSAHASTLAAGGELQPPAGNVVVAMRDVVWAYLAEGEARYMGMSTVAGGTNTLLPLTQESWLSPAAGLKLAGYPTLGVLAAPGWQARVQAFHGLYLDTLTRAISNRHDIETSRLGLRAAKTADALDRTLTRFVRLIADRPLASAARDPDSSLAQACAIAVKPLGVTIAASPQLTRRRANDRPLTVEEIAREARVRTRQVALRGAWWAEDLGPVVAFAEGDGRPLALVPQGEKGYLLHDPTAGTQVPLTAELADTIAPLAWAFYPPLPDGPLSAAKLLKLGLMHQKRDLAVAMAASALGSIMANAVPVATAAVFQTIIPGHHTSQLLQVGLALVIAAAASVIFKITGDVALLRVEGRVAGRLQAGVLDRLLRLPSSFFNSYSTADLANRTLTVEAVRKALTGLVLSSFMAGLFSLTSLGLLFYYQPMTALAALLMFVLLLGASVYTGARQLSTLYEGEALSGNVMSMVLQLITGIQKLRVAGAEERAWIRWGGDFAEMRARAQRGRIISNIHTTALAGWDVLSLALVFLIATSAAGDRLETGQFLAFVSAFTLFMSSMGQVSRAVIQCFNVKPMIDRVKPLLDAIPEVDSSKADPGRLSGDIEVNNVFFRYDQESPRALNGLSVRARPGQFIALVGPSGCGKSTLMKLLLGFERPEAGGIFYDGLDLRTLDIQAVRRQIGVVLQSGRLMPGSIFENIKGASDADVDTAWEAARMAGLDDDIRAMPMGMHTVLTEGSAALSGGQVQRLLISRAIVSKPRIILFDEATSALDNRTQKVVTESLSRLSVTRIAIAHRLSTVQDADVIYVMSEGRVAEAGSYAELMLRNGLFAELARRQIT
jgi:NHLM bacteriocin system ABC transporter ATP-binding protein